MTVLHPLYGSSDPNSLVRTLNELQPKFVVLYDAEMAVVRQLEVIKIVLFEHLTLQSFGRYSCVIVGS